MGIPEKCVSAAVSDERRVRLGIAARGIGFACLILAIAACSSGPGGRPDPKVAITGMFDAIRLSDSVMLAANVDLNAAAQGLRSDLRPAAAGTIGADTSWGQLLLKQMTGEGELRRRWLTDNQIVLGQSEVTGDSALVEVSFLDRITRVQYYNKMRLHFRNERWIVTSFRTM